DGVIEDPGGSEGFDRGGWAFQFNRGDDGDKFKLDEVMAADALLLGRVTYEGFAEAWPSRSGEFADKFNGMAKYVVSTTMGEADATCGIEACWPRRRRDPHLRAGSQGGGGIAVGHTTSSRNASRSSR